MNLCIAKPKVMMIGISTRVLILSAVDVFQVRIFGRVNDFKVL